MRLGRSRRAKAIDMTRDADFKKFVRARMAASDATYLQARTELTRTQPAIEQPPTDRAASPIPNGAPSPLAQDPIIPTALGKSARQFFDDSRLRTIPTKRTKRMAVLLVSSRVSNRVERTRRPRCRGCWLRSTRTLRIRAASSSTSVVSGAKRVSTRWHLRHRPATRGGPGVSPRGGRRVRGAVAAHAAAVTPGVALRRGTSTGRVTRRSS